MVTIDIRYQGRNNGKKDLPNISLGWIEPLIILVIVMGVSFLFYKTGLWQFFTNKERLLQFIGSLGTWDETGFVLLEALQVIIPAIPGSALNVLGGISLRDGRGCCPIDNWYNFGRLYCLPAFPQIR